MSKFDKCERHILATLEEAGQDNIAALLNAIKQDYVTIEIDEYRNALTRLINAKLLELARTFDEASRRWIPLSTPKSVPLLTELHSFLQWSEVDQLWKWSSASPRIEVLLTDTGIAVARKLLSQEGWPSSWKMTSEEQ